MLFDLKPKEKEADFFNYREELEALLGYLRDRHTRLVVLRGLRRTGKSSLLKVALNKSGKKYVLVDARKLTSLSRASFEAALISGLRSVKGLPSSLMERIEGVEVGVRVSLKGREQDVWGLIAEISPVIAVDEVQMLRGSGTDAFFAAAFDNTDCKIVLTGSEIGVLDSFIGKGNPKAPLFGREYREIKTHPLAPGKAREFLRAGFGEAGKKISDSELELAVAELDGVIGWLTSFGNLALSMGAKKAVGKAAGDGALLAYSELESFLASRAQAKARYLAIMESAARGGGRWSTMKRETQLKLKEAVSDSQFADYLDSLVEYGFLEKSGEGYEIPDALLKKALLGRR